MLMEKEYQKISNLLEEQFQQGKFLHASLQDLSSVAQQMTCARGQGTEVPSEENQG